MKKFVDSFLAFVMTFLVFVPAEMMNTEAWFREITDSNDRNNEDGYAIFNKYFHRCSLNEQCNFIVRNSKENTFKGVLNLKELPSDKGGHTIWKKLKKGTYFHLLMSSYLLEHVAHALSTPLCFASSPSNDPSPSR